jgi:hypothetical protein
MSFEIIFAASRHGLPPQNRTICGSPPSIKTFGHRPTDRDKSALGAYHFPLIPQFVIPIDRRFPYAIRFPRQRALADPNGQIEPIFLTEHSTKGWSSAIAYVSEEHDRSSNSSEGARGFLHTSGSLVRAGIRSLCLRVRNRQFACAVCGL